MSSVLTKNYFEIFSLPRRFELDRLELDRRYRHLQRSVHPDRYASGSNQERRIAVQQAAKINEAYEALKDPLLRGRYLLELAGVNIEQEQRNTQDPAFLMQQMELREELDEVRNQPDPLKALDALSGQGLQQYRELEKALVDSLNRKDYQLATETVLKMQFFSRLQDEIQELEAELEDELW